MLRILSPTPNPSLSVFHQDSNLTSSKRATAIFKVGVLIRIPSGGDFMQHVLYITTADAIDQIVESVNNIGYFRGDFLLYFLRPEILPSLRSVISHHPFMPNTLCLPDLNPYDKRFCKSYFSRIVS